MSNQFTINLTYDEYVAANWLHVKGHWWWKGALRYILILGVIVFLIVASAHLPLSNITIIQVMTSAIIGLMAGMIGMAALYVFWLWCIPRNAKKIFREQELLRSATHYSFDAQGLQVINERESSNLRWDHIANWLEDDRMLMLWRTQITFFPIPKSQIGPEVLTNLRNCLTAAGVKQGF